MMFLKLIVRKVTRGTLWLGFPVLRGYCNSTNVPLWVFYKQ
jgi:hypothetical protein